MWLNPKKVSWINLLPERRIIVEKKLFEGKLDFSKLSTDWFNQALFCTAQEKWPVKYRWLLALVRHLIGQLYFLAKSDGSGVAKTNWMYRKKYACRKSSHITVCWIWINIHSQKLSGLNYNFCILIWYYMYLSVEINSSERRNVLMPRTL